MPPLPKPPHLRQRQNKAATRAILRTEEAPFTCAPSLPDGLRDWHPSTLAWWRDVWSSPVAEHYLRSDKWGLLVLAVLVDQFARNPEPGLAGEIRLQSQLFGLTPLDRKRLAWAVAKTGGDDE